MLLQVCVVRPWRSVQVLAMTVRPGWGGQQFMDSVLPKVAALRSASHSFSGDTVDVQVGGGGGSLAHAGRAGGGQPKTACF